MNNTLFYSIFCSFTYGRSDTHTDHQTLRSFYTIYAILSYLASRSHDFCILFKVYLKNNNTSEVFNLKQKQTQTYNKKNDKNPNKYRSKTFFSRTIFCDRNTFFDPNQKYVLKMIFLSSCAKNNNKSGKCFPEKT